MNKNELIRLLVKIAKEESKWDLFIWLEIINEIQTRSKQYLEKVIKKDI